MTKIRSAIIIDYSEMDTLISDKILKKYGVTNILIFKSTYMALFYLKETTVNYEFILIEVTVPVMDGFEFIDKLHELGIHEKQGKICLYTASINSLHKKRSVEKNIELFEKPLTLKKLETIFANQKLL